MKKILLLGDYTASFYKDLTPEETANVLDTLASWTVGESIMERTMENLKSDNSGSTITNNDNHQIIVLISPQTSKSELLNTLSHEVRHVVDIILANCSDCGLSPACLTGEIMSKFADWI